MEYVSVVSKMLHGAPNWPDPSRMCNCFLRFVWFNNIAHGNILLVIASWRVRNQHYICSHYIKVIGLVTCHFQTNFAIMPRDVHTIDDTCMPVLAIRVYCMHVVFVVSKTSCITSVFGDHHTQLNQLLFGMAIILFLLRYVNLLSLIYYHSTKRKSRKDR